MVTHHRFADIAGRRIFYREAGSPAPPAVVLLHGTPAQLAHRNLIPALADRYHVIAPTTLDRVADGALASAR
jgi:pimeloyl-ACP methyl ester carboxylesterase